MLTDKQIALLMAVALLALCALPGLSSPDQFKWTGNAFNSNTNTANDNWNDENNWENISNEHDRKWPSTQGDVVTIDDTSPQAEVEQNKDNNLTINSLTLGDGHTLNLTQGLTIGATLECEGTVKLKGNGTLTVTAAFRVYADQDTTITFESGYEYGNLHVVGGA
ncbi:MAG: hypothetical protein IT449_05525 [Phycisphaerales bacterium]|nr:hypothetical protein [Phycisphaerales bacterium]